MQKTNFDFIKEADILLFKPMAFPKFGYWISKLTQAPYSHAALAHWERGKLYVIEFLEGSGGRMAPAEGYLGTSQDVEVYRCCRSIKYSSIAHNFTSKVAKSICRYAKKCIKLHKKYAKMYIYDMFMTYIPFVRLFRTIDFNDSSSTIRFVCSTLVAHCYREKFVDLVPNLSDKWTKPGDIGKSALLIKVGDIKKADC